MAFATCGLMVEAARKVFICKLKTVEMRTGGLKNIFVPGKNKGNVSCDFVCRFVENTGLSFKAHMSPLVCMTS